MVAEAAIDSVTAGPLAETLGLHRQPSDYLRSPRRTVRRLVRFLNARIQLRSCDHLGHWVRLHGTITVSNRGHIDVGERVSFISRPVGSILATFPGGRLEIGARTFVNYGVDICAVSLVKIGRDCLIGTHVTILDNDFHQLTERNRMHESRPVLIGDGVWIGTRALILPGVTIGAGAVVGAGSVVTTDIPERSVAAGNPARVTKTF